jgi:4-hydroxybenzoate polyprenyltransferase
MEWSLTQNKLLAYHRLMRTDKPIGALLLLWPTLWALWVATGDATAVDPGRIFRRCLADACGGLCGQ